MSLSTAIQEAYARAGTTTRHLMSVEFIHPDIPLPDPVRLIGYDKQVTITLEASAPVDPGIAVPFTPTGIVGQEPSFDGEVDPRITLQIDGVSGQLNSLFSSANATDTPIRAIVRPIAYDVATDTVIGIAGVYDLEVTGAQFTLTMANITMAFTNVANIDFPRIKYSPDSHPTLYA